MKEKELKKKVKIKKKEKRKFDEMFNFNQRETKRSKTAKLNYNTTRCITPHTMYNTTHNV